MNVTYNGTIFSVPPWSVTIYSALHGRSPSTRRSLWPRSILPPSLLRYFLLLLLLLLVHQPLLLLLLHYHLLLSLLRAGRNAQVHFELYRAEAWLCLTGKSRWRRWARPWRGRLSPFRLSSFPSRVIRQSMYTHFVTYTPITTAGVRNGAACSSQRTFSRTSSRYTLFIKIILLKRSYHIWANYAHLCIINDHFHLGSTER